MWQDLIQVHVHLWSLFGDVKHKEVYFLQKTWAKLVETTESEGEK